MIRFPGWMAPWLLAGTMIVLTLKPNVSSLEHLKNPTILLIGFIVGAVGFLLGIPFWIRDRRRAANSSSRRDASN
jgi:hypothetical protein